MRLTQEDEGHHVSLRVGEDVTLTLPETPSTGYQWNAVVAPDLLEEREHRFEGAAEAQGGVGTRVISFRAVGPGRATLHCDRRRAWEKDAVDQFEVYLDITD